MTPDESYAAIATGPGAGARDRLGLPQEGAGSVAPAGRRLVQYLVDAVTAGLVAGLFTRGASSDVRTFVPLGVFVLATVVGLVLAGQTFGMRVLGMRLDRLGGGRPSLRSALVRQLLLSLLIPAVIYDADGRGLHDKAAGTVLVRT